MPIGGFGAPPPTYINTYGGIAQPPIPVMPVAQPQQSGGLGGGLPGGIPGGGTSGIPQPPIPNIPMPVSMPSPTPVSTPYGQVPSYQTPQMPQMPSQISSLMSQLQSQIRQPVTPPPAPPDYSQIFSQYQQQQAPLNAQIQSMISQLGQQQPLNYSLPPQVAAWLAQSQNAAQMGADRQFAEARGDLLADLVGRGLSTPSEISGLPSNIAEGDINSLSSLGALQKAQISGQYADMGLGQIGNFVNAQLSQQGLRQQGLGTGISALGAMGSQNLGAAGLQGNLTGQGYQAQMQGYQAQQQASQQQTSNLMSLIGQEWDMFRQGQADARQFSVNSQQLLASAEAEKDRQLQRDLLQMQIDSQAQKTQIRDQVAQMQQQAAQYSAPQNRMSLIGPSGNSGGSGIIEPSVQGIPSNVSATISNMQGALGGPQAAEALNQRALLLQALIAAGIDPRYFNQLMGA